MSQQEAAPLSQSDLDQIQNEILPAINKIFDEHAEEVNDALNPNCPPQTYLSGDVDENSNKQRLFVNFVAPTDFTYQIRQKLERETTRLLPKELRPQTVFEYCVVDPSELWVGSMEGWEYPFLECLQTDVAPKANEILEAYSLYYMRRGDIFNYAVGIKQEEKWVIDVKTTWALDRENKKHLKGQLLELLHPQLRQHLAVKYRVGPIKVSQAPAATSHS
ncbi:hypothetical protein F5Y15DRAFT_419351 [Xylariaceae sp. FL0016]|nr:hypothetical protein F5Y15DRAFT_419351 [Xylariaceae sp. FL0016]